uniref:Centrosomal protein of 89 kDa-like n=1 Tax=Phallusia mammillata TaxID=59560 RepID=A0A6F9D8I5_9ASCI|nr:centrosomal protein of 89 kDa-like [Phallusia mammillata]
MLVVPVLFALLAHNRRTKSLTHMVIRLVLLFSVPQKLFRAV